MLGKFWDGFLNVFGLSSRSDTYTASHQSSIQSRDFPDDDIMVFDEPLLKKRKLSHNIDINYKPPVTSQKLSSSLRNFLHSRKNHPENTFNPKLKWDFSKDSEENMKNKENTYMSEILRRKMPHKNECSVENKSGSLSFEPVSILRSSKKCDSPKMDPNFRFSPSLTSTQEFNKRIKKREPIRSSQNQSLLSSSILNRRTPFSRIEKDCAQFSKPMSPISSPNIKRKVQTSYRLKEKLCYHKLLQKYMTGDYPSNSSEINPERGIDRLSKVERTRNAMSCGALTVTPFDVIQAATLKCGNSAINASPKPKGPSKIKSPITESLKETLTIPSNGKLEKETEFDADLIITKEILNNETQRKIFCPVERKCLFSKFYNQSPVFKSSIAKNRINDHIEQLSQKSKERSEKLRKSSKTTNLNDVSQRFGKIDLNFPSVVKEINLEEEEEELPPLTPEIMNEIEKAMRGPPSQVLTRKFNIDITRKDIRTLSGLNWLNDEVINFYMNLLMERGGQNNLPRVYAFSTFFYPNLINVKKGYGYVRRWTKKVDIFSYDLLLIPIHLGMHWCLATIDVKEKTVKYYDSMSGDNEKCLHVLLKYLQDEHMDKKKERYDISDWKAELVKDIPQQMNGSDCGMFSCKFADYLSRRARITFTQEHMPYFRKRMVYEIVKQKLM